MKFRDFAGRGFFQKLSSPVIFISTPLQLAIFYHRRFSRMSDFAVQDLPAAASSSYVYPLPCARMQDADFACASRACTPPPSWLAGADAAVVLYAMRAAVVVVAVCGEVACGMRHARRFRAAACVVAVLCRACVASQSQTHARRVACARGVGMRRGALPRHASLLLCFSRRPSLIVVLFR
jgi:hypothetical protein